MISKKFLEIINKIDNNLIIRFKDINKNDKENILSRALKLWEEVWELNTEILSKYYKKRDKDFDIAELEHEFADVIITTLLLAKSLDIDINKALESKLSKIENRWGV